MYCKASIMTNSTPVCLQHLIQMNVPGGRNCATLCNV